MRALYLPYPEYKDSGVEWLGPVPIEWDVTKLKYTASIFGRIGFRGYTVNDIVDEGNGAIVLSPSNIDEDQFTLVKRSYLSWVKYYESPEIMVSDGDVLMVKTGSTFGKSTIVKNLDEPMTINPQMALMKDSKLDSRYLSYLLNSNLIKAKINVSNTGSGMPTMTQENMNGFPVPRPSNELATHIANFLDHETAKIDTLIEKQQQLIKLLKEKRQAVISHAVTKGLNPNAPMRDSGVEWLGEVPAHWGVCKLKHIIASLESGVSVNAADLPAQSGQFGVLKTSCVYTRLFRVEENKTVVKEEYDRVKCPIRKGAIIISRMNTPELVGASALVDVEDPNIFLPDRLWQTVFKDEERHNPKFIAYFMMIKGFRSQISFAAEGASGSMQNIAKGDYLSINIAFPDSAEQNGIVDYLENRISDLNGLENRVQMAIELIQERRTALISAAVTGKIDVRNWQAPEPLDTNDKEVAA